MTKKREKGSRLVCRRSTGRKLKPKERKFFKVKLSNQIDNSALPGSEM